MSLKDIWEKMTPAGKKLLSGVYKESAQLEREVISHFWVVPPPRQGIMLAAIEPYMFATPAYRRLWALLRERRDQGTTEFSPAIIFSLPAEDQAQLQPGQGIVPDDPGTTEYLIRAMREEKVKRNAKAVGAFISTTPSISAQEAVLLLQETTHKLMETAGIREAPTMGEVAREVLERPRALYIPTGFYEFDRAFGGLVKGGINVIAGHQKSGKTSLLTQLSIQLAAQGEKVLYFNLEKDKSFIVTKALCQMASVPIRKFYQSQLDPVDVANLQSAQRTLDRLALRILTPAEDDPAARTVNGVILYARHAQEMWGTTIFILDYVQKLGSDYQMLSKAIYQLQDTSAEGLTFIMASQITKQGKEQHGYNSKVLNQVADLFVVLEEADARERKMAHVIEARFSEPGRRTLEWQGEFTRFADPTKGCPLDEIPMILGGDDHDIPF